MTRETVLIRKVNLSYYRELLAQCIGDRCIFFVRHLGGVEAYWMLHFQDGLLTVVEKYVFMDTRLGCRFGLHGNSI